MAAAATYAGIAFVLALGLAPHWRATLSGIAVAIAVAVACSRVLLGVHWFSDAIAGLLLGWTWFGLVAVAYGGRVLKFGAPAKAASSSPRASQRKRNAA
jgi:undecaprenyl-diphosphatase